MSAENYQVPKLTLDEATELLRLVRERRHELEAALIAEGPSKTRSAFQEEFGVIESLTRKL